MSYTQIVNHDPPIITVGLSGGTGLKDSTKHLLASKECTVNIISEWFIEYVLVLFLLP
jgi:flavin reductase (DIM6/NTAB) family NADH-FMN oxidoreductase RutF